MFCVTLPPMSTHICSVLQFVCYFCIWQNISQFLVSSFHLHPTQLLSCISPTSFPYLPTLFTYKKRICHTYHLALIWRSGLIHHSFHLAFYTKEEWDNNDRIMGGWKRWEKEVGRMRMENHEIRNKNTNVTINHGYVKICIIICSKRNIHKISSICRNITQIGALDMKLCSTKEKFKDI